MTGLSPLLLLHIGTATVGLLSGYMAILVRKGSGLHSVVGNVFFVSMLTMSASAAYIAAFHKPNGLNVVVGLLTFYLVATAWWTAKHRDGRTSRFDAGALLFVVGVAAAGLTFGFEAASGGGKKDGMPAGLYFFFAFAALLAVRSDVRMLRRGGVTGPARITRHLLRMGFALLIATFSFFPGQAKLFPPALRKSGILMLPHALLVGSMIYGARRMKRKTPVPPASRDARDMLPACRGLRRFASMTTCRMGIRSSSSMT